MMMMVVVAVVVAVAVGNTLRLKPASFAELGNKQYRRRCNINMEFDSNILVVSKERPFFHNSYIYMF